MDNSTAPSSNSSVSILKKLQALLQNGQHYDAQQMLKSLHNRNINQRKFDRAVQLLFMGIRNMFQHGQSALALELGRCMIETFEKAGIESESQLRDTKFVVTRQSSMNAIELVETIAKAFPEADEKRIEFLNDGIKFTKKVLKRRDENGDAHLHQLLANEYWKMGEYHQAHRQFVRSENVENEHTKLLIEWAQHGLHNERDLFIARAVLHLLCRLRTDHAKRVFDGYMQQWTQEQKIGEPNDKSTSTPLTNFIKLLFVAIDHKNQALYQYLLQQYQPVLKRDANLKRFLDQIAQVYFGIKQQQSGLDGMLGSLMSSLFGGGNNSSSSSTNTTRR